MQIPLDLDWSNGVYTEYLTDGTYLALTLVKEELVSATTQANIDCVLIEHITAVGEKQPISSLINFATTDTIQVKSEYLELSGQMLSSSNCSKCYIEVADD